MRPTDILIVSDFDNTLTGLGHQVPQNNRDAIVRFMEAGGAFTVGTGRARNFFAPQKDQVPRNAPCVLSNGSVLYHYETDETLYMANFSEEERKKIPALLEHVGGEMRMTIESGYQDYMPEELWRWGDDPEGWMPAWWKANAHKIEKSALPKPPMRAPLMEIPQPWVKLVFTGDQAGVDALGAAAEAMGLQGVHSMPGMYEIQPSGVDKGSGARRLAQMLGRSVLVCIGDAPNDTAMLRAADYAFVPISAEPEMQAMGFRPCAHMNEGAVADVIAQLMQMCE